MRLLIPRPPNRRTLHQRAARTPALPRASPRTWPRLAWSIALFAAAALGMYCAAVFEGWIGIVYFVAALLNAFAGSFTLDSWQRARRRLRRNGGVR